MEPQIAKYFREKSHWILFEPEGKVIGQSPGLGGFAGHSSASLFDTYPMLESMCLALDECPPGEEIVLPCVRTTLGRKEGWFDFVFHTVPNEGAQVCCCQIMDLSEQYFRLFTLQQHLQQKAMDQELTNNQPSDVVGNRLSDATADAPHLAGMLNRIQAQNTVILDRLETYLSDEHSKNQSNA